MADISHNTKAYLVGGGIASLACAAYLIRDGHVPGRNIRIFEEARTAGGSLDAQGSADTGYVLRGGRMFDEEAYTCTYDLLSSIPSLRDPHVSVKEEMDAFNKTVKTSAKARLVENGRKVDVSSPGFSHRDRAGLLGLMALPEDVIGPRRIDDFFAPSFFETNFWFEWCTTFAFQPWHSAIEFKRYLLRFIHEFPRLNTLSGVRRTPYNQYDAIVVPVIAWLQAQGVHVDLGTRVMDLDFAPGDKEKTVERIHLRRDGKQEDIVVTKDDYVFVTIGSMTADSSFGSMTAAPRLETEKSGGAWTLWEAIARKQPDCGRPSVFDGRIDESLWESFTVTFRDPTFFRRVQDFTGNALATFKDSHWLMSVVLPHQPYFINQPDDVTVCWGYGLFPNKEGNYVRKTMSTCTGEEILTELCAHLGFDEGVPRILTTSTCIPCMMPYITSQFLTRQRGDRPLVVPDGSTNLAFLGQYCEIPDDVVFTVEYSVRSAQTAVYTLLHVDKKVAPIYKGLHDLNVVYESIRTMFS